MMIFCFFFLIFLNFSTGEEDQEEKKPNPKPEKAYTDTVEDDVVDINDHEKIPIS